MTNTTASTAFGSSSKFETLLGHLLHVSQTLTVPSENLIRQRFRLVYEDAKFTVESASYLDFRVLLTQIINELREPERVHLSKIYQHCCQAIEYIIQDDRLAQDQKAFLCKIEYDRQVSVRVQFTAGMVGQDHTLGLEHMADV